MKKLLTVFFIILFSFSYSAEKNTKVLSFCEKLELPETKIKKSQIPLVMNCLQKTYLMGDSQKLSLLIYKIKPVLKEDSFEMGMFYFYESWLYYSLRNIPEAKKSIQTLQEITKEIADVHKRTILELETLKIINNIEEISTNNRSIVIKNSLKIFNETEKIKASPADYHYFKARAAYTLTNFYLDNNDLKKANFYKDLFFKHSKLINNPFLNVRQYKLLGNFEKNNGNLKAATELYEKAVKIAKANGISYEVYSLSPSLSVYFGKLGNLEKSVAYSNSYIKMEDSIKKANIQTSEIMTEGQKSLPQSNSNRLLYLLTFLAGVSVVSIYGFYKSRINRLPIVPHQHNSDDVSTVKTNSEEITDLVSLAKVNEEAFYIKFPELYPDLNKKLVDFDPQLSSTDIKFTMYLKMKFSTKEIAQYTNSTVKAVENKKYRLRKKLNIASDKDIYLAIDEI